MAKLSQAWKFIMLGSAYLISLFCGKKLEEEALYAPGAPRGKAGYKSNT